MTGEKTEKKKKKKKKKKQPPTFARKDGESGASVDRRGLVAAKRSGAARQTRRRAKAQEGRKKELRDKHIKSEESGTVHISRPVRNGALSQTGLSSISTEGMSRLRKKGRSSNGHGGGPWGIPNEGTFVRDVGTIESQKKKYWEKRF